MIASKHITRIVAGMVCICLVFCGFIVYAANVFDTTKVTEYQKRLFNGENISLEIKVDESDWQALLDNAQTKEWISGTLIINGEAFNSVGIRTKGNSSLSQGMRSDGNRYSLQFKFNKYVKGQTYYGLDAFCVNNMMGDATYMKDYISYNIMSFIGVDTPLINYASITVNGEDYGFGLALERYDESFLDRVYNTSAGELYSVKIGMGNRGDFEDRWQDVENAFPGIQQPEGSSSGQQPPEDSERQNFIQGGGRAMGGFGGMGAGNGGGSLVYSGDDPSGYSAIFDNVVIGTASDKDKERVIAAIKNLGEGTDLEKYIDVDATLRYFAAHTVVVNLDSYTSNMAQNYYIYERGGKLTILPWDYGLAFGGFQSGNASSVVNFPIDTPVSGVSMEDRPLIGVLLKSDEYRERYHDYLQQIVEGYFESGRFSETVNSVDAKINEYVKNDVSAYYTYEQYTSSLKEFIKLGNLRAESIKGQLDGTIPSTSSGQSADNSALIDTSSVNLSALGSMMGGMGQGNWSRDREEMPGGQGGFSQDGGFGMPGGGMFDMELMQQAMQILMDEGGELTDEVKASLLELGLTEEEIGMFANMQNRMPGVNGGQGEFPGGNNTEGIGGNQGNMPGVNAPLGMNRLDAGNVSNAASQPNPNIGSIVLTLALLTVLAGAIIFVARPRKNMI